MSINKSLIVFAEAKKTPNELSSLELYLDHLPHKNLKQCSQDNLLGGCSRLFFCKVNFNIACLSNNNTSCSLDITPSVVILLVSLCKQYSLYWVL